MPRPRPHATETPVVARRSLLLTGRVRDVQIASAGWIPRKRVWIHQTFSLHAVGLVVAGRGTYQVNDGPVQPIGPGSAFAVFPGPVFHYGPAEGEAWSEHYVTMTGPGLRRWLSAGWLWNDGAVHQLDHWSTPVDLHGQIMRALTRGEPGDTDRAVVLTERYLLELYYARSAVAPRAAELGLDAVLAHCRSHCAKPIDFVELARRQAMSYSSLRQRLREATGLPPARYLVRLRCDAARTLLTETDLPIKAIGPRVGIADAYTFSRTFKRCVGVSPEHYRRQHAPWLRAPRTSRT